MSNVLLIRHLCGNLDVSERVDFLKRFGAQNVWFVNERSHSAFASFISCEAAEEALYRLHQVEVLGKRLVVEYAQTKNQTPNTLQCDSENRTTIANLKEFVNRLNGINSFIDFTQPPPPHLSYKYPPGSSAIFFNILYALSENVGFYTQVLHLMNKLGLDPPFADVRNDVKSFINKCLLDIGIVNEYTERLSSEESEISCDESEKPPVRVNIIKPVKRKSNIIYDFTKKLKPNKISSIHRTPMTTEEVFEDITPTKHKKIEINVNSMPSTNSPVEIVGEIGKIDPFPNKEIIEKPDDASQDPIQPITDEEIRNNKISVNDMKILPVFKNYASGAPSLRLYIKNLSKVVTAQDITNIYQRYLSGDNSDEEKTFDVRVMQEGRMKGQAFVTFPNVETSQRALAETNGFIFKDKPMVVQFARTANK
jgi:U11/U12 small nuclear ribonucleoprotein 65 kDa protein